MRKLSRLLILMENQLSGLGLPERIYCCASFKYWNPWVCLFVAVAVIMVTLLKQVSIFFMKMNGWMVEKISN